MLVEFICLARALGARELFTGLALCLVLVVVSESAFAQTQATELFGEHKNQVRQIRVIDIASADKFSTGSGFAIDTEGHLATNYHVVSAYVHEPEKYRLEAIRHDDTVEPLVLVAVDVIHDLAIVSSGQPTDRFLKLSTQSLSNGDRIYSMGNPLDLGLTIIEGTYNGLVEQSRYRKILFSGSLNPGMSGGPALNQAGEVIGINVSKGGEQISFLVPVDHLATLLNETRSGTRSTDFDTQIAADLLADQQQFYESVLARIVSDRELGDLIIPDKLDDSLNCWGHSEDEEDTRYQATHQHCQSEDSIFVTDEIYLGNFRYDFEFVHTEELNRFQFYTFLESRFIHRQGYINADEEEVSDYACHDSKVALASGSWKISTCMRSLLKLGGLLEASMTMASLDYPDKTAIVKVYASGISPDNALVLFRRLSEAVSWKH